MRRESRRNPRDHLDLKIKAGKPVDPKCQPVWIWRRGEHVVLDLQDSSELFFRVGMKAGDIDDIVERAARCSKSRFKIGKRTPDLSLKVWLGAAVTSRPNCPESNSRSADRV